MRPLSGIVVALSILSTAALAAELPAVARPHYTVAGRDKAIGTVFFLALDDGRRAVAVGAAHSHPLDDLAATPEIEFRLGASGRRVARASRFLVPPGRSFRDDGASFADDYLVFALDDRPYGIHTLRAREAALQAGDRVQVQGVPHDGAVDAVHASGRIVRADADRLEIDLDARVDLRGWGGGPIVDSEGRVAGILEAAWPEGSGLRIGAAPISPVLAAARNPLEGGAGRPFSHFGDAAGSEPTAPAPAAVAAVAPPAPAAAAPTHLEAERSGPSELDLSIERPLDGAIIGDENGAFIAGRAIASIGVTREFDVVFVIDTSQSTSQPSGADIDGDGRVGQSSFGLFASTDPGDSVLAAEVAAALNLLKQLDPRSTRVGIVSFAGEGVPSGGGIVLGRNIPPAQTEEPLTTDYDRVRKTLYEIRKRRPRGNTHMAAGVDQATIELLSLAGSLSEPRRDAEKISLFFTDGQPTLPYDVSFRAENVKAVLRAADRARRARVRIHSFALGPEALDGPIATVRMASLTGGVFTPVRHPADLISAIQEVNFADIESIVVRNLTTSEEARHVTVNADGLFGALLPLKAGKNRIAIEARTSDGAEASHTLELQYAPGTPTPPLPTPLVSLRNDLLERRLLEIRQGRLEATEAMRKELRVEIERERAEANQRAEKQRKELDLEPVPQAP